jgi:hypothetical protein
MRYKVEPGLYSLGSPGPTSPVLVSANYKLSFDVLRGDLAGIDAWIVVLDTRGINVWCAAAAGTFCAEELIERVRKTRIAEIVSHRTLIVPQLGAVGVEARTVEKHTGFSVKFGPVRSRDLPAYLSCGNEARPEMRAVRFGVLDRLTLAPMELGQSLMRFPAFAFVAFVLAGLTPGGVEFGKAWAGAWPLFALGFGSIFAGSFLVPLLLPWLPFRSFSLKGWLAGAAVNALLLHAAGLARGMHPFLIGACWIFFPAASAFMALAFTGATPITNRSGVSREVRLFMAVFIAVGILTLLYIALWKMKQWSVL